MNNTFIILQREYFTRVKKKSFIILTLSLPLILCLFVAVPVAIALWDKPEHYTVAIEDETGILASRLSDEKYFNFILGTEQEATKGLTEEEKKNMAFLIIPANIFSHKQYEIRSFKQLPFSLTDKINSKLEHEMEAINKDKLYGELGIAGLEDRVKATQVHLNQKNLQKTSDGKLKQSETKLSSTLGYIAGFLMYFFVIMYGNMVMQAVLEEKTNRVIEIIVSSVKPIQFMMGKILGIALVGVTQLCIWLVIGVVIFMGLGVLGLGVEESSSITDMASHGPVISGQEFGEIIESFESYNFMKIILGFILFFTAGYLLYSSLMAGLASAVNSTEEVGQFTTPIMMPIVLSFLIMNSTINNPHGLVAIIFSYFPLTSPIIMAARIPFDVPWWEVCLSFAILSASTFGAVWVSARIYRTGILMYGKKPSWNEILKWLRIKHY